jgi:hypothetical protein
MVSAEIKSPCPPGCIVIDLGEQIQSGHMVFFEDDEEIEVFDMAQAKAAESHPN